MYGCLPIPHYVVPIVGTTLPSMLVLLMVWISAYSTLCCTSCRDNPSKYVGITDGITLFLFLITGDKYPLCIHISPCHGSVAFCSSHDTQPWFSTPASEAELRQPPCPGDINHGWPRTGVHHGPGYSRQDFPLVGSKLSLSNLKVTEHTIFIVYQ